MMDRFLRMEDQGRLPVSFVEPVREGWLIRFRTPREQSQGDGFSCFTMILGGSLILGIFALDLFPRPANFYAAAVVALGCTWSLIGFRRMFRPPTLFALDTLEERLVLYDTALPSHQARTAGSIPFASIECFVARRKFWSADGPATLHVRDTEGQEQLLISSSTDDERDLLAEARLLAYLCDRPAFNEGRYDRKLLTVGPECGRGPDDLPLPAHGTLVSKEALPRPSVEPHEPNGEQTGDV